MSIGPQLHVLLEVEPDQDFDTSIKLYFSQTLLSKK